MSYISDVFISYRREEYAWTPWARDIFKPALESCLQRELSKRATVYFDEDIPPGLDFVTSLADGLASSKVMLPLFSRDYFSSNWCVHELDLMLQRAGNRGIVIPILVHDGEVIPDAVSKLVYKNFTAYSNPMLMADAPLYKQFWDDVARLAAHIREAIDTLPDFDHRWTARFRRRLVDVFKADLAGKVLKPQQFALKPAISPKTPPRPRPRT